MLTSLEGNTEINTCEEINAVDSSIANDKFSLLEQKFNLTQEAIQSSPIVQPLRQKLERLAYEARMPFHAEILTYWKDTQKNEPALAKLAEVVLSVPCSQTSVERAFSALSLILTKHRSRLNSDNIDNLLFIRLNESLFQNTKFSD